MIISVSGMGYTGSGAVKDFLKQYDLTGTAEHTFRIWDIL